MKLITYKGETHTLKEWIEILKLSEEGHQYTQNDDLIEFAKEVVFNGKITNENLYKAYTIWCGENPMPPTVFAKRISIVFKEHRPDLQRFRTRDIRGWQKMADFYDNDDV